MSFLGPLKGPDGPFVLSPFAFFEQGFLSPPGYSPTIWGEFPVRGSLRVEVPRFPLVLDTVFGV